MAEDADLGVPLAKAQQQMPELGIIDASVGIKISATTSIIISIRISSSINMRIRIRTSICFSIRIGMENALTDYLVFARARGLWVWQQRVWNSFSILQERFRMRRYGAVRTVACTPKVPTRKPAPQTTSLWDSQLAAIFGESVSRDFHKLSWQHDLDTQVIC